MDRSKLKEFIISSLQELLSGADQPVPEIDDSTVIFGKNGLLDSMMLVELMLGLEEYCEAEGRAFSWTDDATMSEKRSIYNSVASLTDFLLSLPEQK